MTARMSTSSSIAPRPGTGPPEVPTSAELDGLARRLARMAATAEAAERSPARFRGTPPGAAPASLAAPAGAGRGSEKSSLAAVAASSAGQSNAGMVQAAADATVVHEDDMPAPMRGREASLAGHVVHLNLVALIDVVFLLLCYFMLSANFTLGERIYDIAMPEETPGSEAVAEDPFALPERPIRVTVAQTGPGPGDVWYGVDVPGAAIRDAEDLYRYLSTNRVTDLNPRGLFMSDTPIFIQPTAGTAWSFAVDAFNAAVRAEYEVIRFVRPEMTDEGEGGGRSAF